MYRRTSKYAKRREWHPRPAIAETDQRPAAWRPPRLRRRVTIEDFDGAEPCTHVVELFRTPRIDSYRAVIDGRRIEEIPEVWAEVKAALRGYAPATVNHLGRILRQLGRLAWQEWRWADHPPAIHLLPETPRETFLTVGQVDALAAACGDPRAAGYVLLAAYTGIRRGHLLRLTSADVQDGFIALDRSGKTARLQRVPVHPRVAAIAARLPLAIGDRQLREAWALARSKTGIRCRWHDLRHTCASWLCSTTAQ